VRYERITEAQLEAEDIERAAKQRRPVKSSLGVLLRFPMRGTREYRAAARRGRLW